MPWSLNCLANSGDDYPFQLPHPDRIDLAGEAAQFNAPDADFPDTNGNGVVDEPIGGDSGLFNFSEPGTEQDALAEYLTEFFAETPFGASETPPRDDRRIQNLAVPGIPDTVFE